MLNDYSEDEVHLFESDTRAGGHANTVDYAKAGASEGESTRVDTYVSHLCFDALMIALLTRLHHLSQRVHRVSSSSCDIPETSEFLTRMPYSAASTPSHTQTFSAS